MEDVTDKATSKLRDLYERKAAAQAQAEVGGRVERDIDTGVRDEAEQSPSKTDKKRARATTLSKR